jgi:hypothetical protein
MKNVGLSVLLFIVFFSCKNTEKPEAVEKNTILIDIKGDSLLETLHVIENKNGTTDIYLNNEKIIGVGPLFDKEYKNTLPPIENVYIEGNNIQQANKGFRIIIRNTDTSPDYFFADILYVDDWIIKSIGIINSQDENNLYIIKKSIDERIQKGDIFDEYKNFNFKTLCLKYKITPYINITTEKR